jgi:anti-sigma regulatory factor (Ser/Thr protein kinase)
MSRLNPHQMMGWITAAAVQHSHDLVAHVAERVQASRPAARKAITRLVDAGWLIKEGTTSRPIYRPGLLRQVVASYALNGLVEDVPWERDFAPNFVLPPHVQRMAQHVFGEILNNAIDHSGGLMVTVSLRQTPSHVQLLVSDDGRGLFDRIRESFAIDDAQHAMLELSKGKLTSLPNRHTGRGLFFSAQLADVFEVHANGSNFQRRGWDGGGWHCGKPLARQGTSVYASIALDTERTLDSVMNVWSQDQQGIAFDRTRVPLRLLLSTGSALDSRAQARRAASRLEQFKHARIDFSGVSDIGHSFADELFRVFAHQHPDLELMAENMTPRVANLIHAVISGQAS